MRSTPTPTALFLLLLSLFLLTHPVFSQDQLSFQKFTEEDGLKNTFVTSLLQDKAGFLWMGTANGVHRFDGYGFKSFGLNQSDNQGLSHQTVWCLAQGREDFLWFGTSAGLNRFDPETETFTHFLHYAKDTTSLTSSNIESLGFDREGALWVGTDNGLNRMCPNGEGFDRFWYRPGGSCHVRSILTTKDSSLWISVADTLFKYEAGEDSFLAYPFTQQDTEANEILTLYEDSQGYIWVGTQMNGAFRFDPTNSNFDFHITDDPRDTDRLSHNKVAAFLEHEGQMWMGTYGGGLNIWNRANGQLRHFLGDAQDPTQISSEVIPCLFKDRDDNIWLGSFYDGLYQYKSDQNRFLNYRSFKGIPSKRIQFIQQKGQNEIWVGLASGGIAVLDVKTKKLLRSYGATSNPPLGDWIKRIVDMYVDEEERVWISSSTGQIFTFQKEKEGFVNLSEKLGIPLVDWLQQIWPLPNGDIWLGTQKGMVKYVDATQSLMQYELPNPADDPIPQEKNLFVNAMLMTSKGQFWIATYGGMNLYDAESDSFSFFRYPHQILGFCEDPKGFLWLGTNEGLVRFDPINKTFEPQRHKKLFAKSVGAPIMDHHGTLWFCTGAGGIQQFDPSNKQVKAYDKRDGMVGNFFWRSARGPDDVLYFGGMDGISAFHPDSLRPENRLPSIALTDFILFHNSAPIRNSLGDSLTWPSPMLSSPNTLQKITLAHWQNYFSLEFAALHFTAPENNRYRYQLVGHDRDWLETAADRRLVHYTKLDPGNYIFRVQTALRNGEWSPEELTLEIKILSPWWQTWWAYLLYGLAFTTIGLTLHFFQVRRKMAQAEASKYREIDEVKTQLFTNVTHEFRTPITVILGMAELLRQDPQSWMNEGVSAIQRNGQQLLGLINKLLDLAKLEAQHMRPEYFQGNVISFIAYLVEPFQVLAASRNIKLQFSKRDDELIMDFSQEFMAKILNNLLSNALKFTSENGRILLEIGEQEGQFFISLSDDGIGIPEEEIPFIFNRFFQVPPIGDQDNTQVGTGVGLAIVKELVELMNGTIDVISQPGQHTTFRIFLPIHRQAPPWSGSWENSTHLRGHDSQSESWNAIDPDGLPILLLIEDNQDVANYIIACMRDTYQVLYAQNGEEGVKMALQQIPDIIICDLMMPRLDGFKVCQTLKKETITSHIPIVILTAKSDELSRIAGLQAGADVYLTKPFNRKELLVRIERLIYIRRQLQERYQTWPKRVTPKPKQPAFDKEQDFLERLRTVILDNIENEDLTMEDICQLMTTSRSKLHRKLKALTGRPTSHVVRSIRLQYAKQLVLETDLTIAQVAYKSGFKHHSYFTNLFREEFGNSPIDIRGIKTLEQ